MEAAKSRPIKKVLGEFQVRNIVITCATVSFLATAAYAAPATSTDYLRASRCKALAETIGKDTVDTTQVKAFLKSEFKTQPAFVVDKGQEEADRAKREARNAGNRDRLSAELEGGCVAYLAPGQAIASR